MFVGVGGNYTFVCVSVGVVDIIINTFFRKDMAVFWSGREKIILLACVCLFGMPCKRQ